MIYMILKDFQFFLTEKRLRMVFNDATLITRHLEISLSQMHKSVMWLHSHHMIKRFNFTIDSLLINTSNSLLILLILGSLLVCQNRILINFKNYFVLRKEQETSSLLVSVKSFRIKFFQNPIHCYENYYRNSTFEIFL